MTPSPAPVVSLRRTGLDSLVAVGLLTAIVFFLISGGRAYQNIMTLRDDNRNIVHSHQAIVALDDLLSSTKDAETGQRGFLLTGDPKYLEPYNAARAEIDAKISEVAELTRDDSTQQARIGSLRRQIDAKMAELQETIDLKRSRGDAAALAVVTSDRGKAAMDAIRGEI